MVVPKWTNAIWTIINMGFVDLWITSVEQYKHSNRLRIPTSRQHKVIELSTLRIFGTWLNLNLSFNEILHYEREPWLGSLCQDRPLMLRQAGWKAILHSQAPRTALYCDFRRHWPDQGASWSTYKVKPSRKQCFCQRHIVKMNDQSHWLVPFTNVKGCQMMCI